VQKWLNGSRFCLGKNLFLLTLTRWHECLLGCGGDASLSTPIIGDTETVSRLQDDAQLALSRYIDASSSHLHVAKPFRFGKLLLLVASLRSVGADTIEEMYFRSTLGDIRVSDIVADMFASADVWRHRHAVCHVISSCYSSLRVFHIAATLHIPRSWRCFHQSYFQRLTKLLPYFIIVPFSKLLFSLFQFFCTP